MKKDTVIEMIETARSNSNCGLVRVTLMTGSNSIVDLADFDETVSVRCIEKWIKDRYDTFLSLHIEGVKRDWREM